MKWTRWPPTRWAQRMAEEPGQGLLIQKGCPFGVGGLRPSRAGRCDIQSGMQLEYEGAAPLPVLSADSEWLGG